MLKLDPGTGAMGGSGPSGRLVVAAIFALLLGGLGVTLASSWRAAHVECGCQAIEVEILDADDLDEFDDDYFDEDEDADDEADELSDDDDGCDVEEEDDFPALSDDEAAPAIEKVEVELRDLETLR